MLDVVQDKLDAWDDAKDDYDIELGGKPVPNSMGSGSDALFTHSSPPRHRGRLVTARADDAFATAAT